ncbi:MAG: epoxyqueuosine reductase QueH [Thermoplasmata archaeon]|nr:epoxyqueuosine reductase QueH [Thermoplasmata archaeon]
MLLHVCCAPCSTHVIDKLRSEYELTCYFYNPNIYPQEEYLKRLGEFRAYAEKTGVGFAEGDFDSERWMTLTESLKDEKEGGKRCDVCYQMRLEETARYASESGFDAFTTTLSISPRKRADIINRLGIDTAKAHNIRFLEEDFKKGDGFKHSVEMSKEEEMYRQDYCGCIYSKAERDERKADTSR